MFLKRYYVSYNAIHWFNLLMGIWGIIFKNEPSKIWARQSLNNMKWYGLLRQTKPLQLFFKGCLLQILFGPFLNTLPICRWRRKCDKAEEKKKLWYINLWQFYYHWSNSFKCKTCDLYDVLTLQTRIIRFFTG